MGNKFVYGNYIIWGFMKRGILVYVKRSCYIVGIFLVGEILVKCGYDLLIVFLKLKLWWGFLNIYRDNCIMY